MKNRINMLYRVLTSRNIIVIYSKRLQGDISSSCIVDTQFTTEDDSTVLLSFASKMNETKQ